MKGRVRSLVEPLNAPGPVPTAENRLPGSVQGVHGDPCRNGDAVHEIEIRMVGDLDIEVAVEVECVAQTVRPRNDIRRGRGGPILLADAVMPVARQVGDHFPNDAEQSIEIVVGHETGLDVRSNRGRARPDRGDPQERFHCCSHPLLTSQGAPTLLPREPFPQGSTPTRRLDRPTHYVNAEPSTTGICIRARRTGRGRIPERHQTHPIPAESDFIGRDAPGNDTVRRPQSPIHSTRRRANSLSPLPSGKV